MWETRRFLAPLGAEGLSLSQNLPERNRTKQRMLIAIGLSIAFIYVCAALLTDSTKLADALRQLGWRGCAAVLGLSVLNYLLRFERWQYYLGHLGRHLSAGRHLLYYLSGFAFTVSPAKAGEAMRSLYLQDHGITYADSIAAFFVERLLDLLAIVALASLIVIDHTQYRPMLIASIGLLAGILVTTSQGIGPVWIDRLPLKFPRVCYFLYFRIGLGWLSIANMSGQISSPTIGLSGAFPRRPIAET